MSNEGPKNIEGQFSFVYPDVEVERGEIERVASEFAGEDSLLFTNRFIEKAKNTSLTTMSKEKWRMLENTDSFDIQSGDWETVEHHAVAGHSSAPRDWQKLKEKMEKGVSLDAPIICQKGGRLHLVSGNARLMVAKALGNSPQVLLVNMD